MNAMLMFSIWLIGAVVFLGGFWVWNQNAQARNHLRDKIGVGKSMFFSAAWPVTLAVWIGIGILVGVFYATEFFDDMWGKQVLFKPSKKKAKCNARKSGGLC